MIDVNNSIRRAFDAAISILYPTACRACGAMVESWRDGVACSKCWDEVGPIAPACAKCGLSLRMLPAQLEIDQRRCGLCEELAFTHARSCGPYEGALRENVLWLKANPQVPPRLRELLCAAFEDLHEMEPVESLIPVGMQHPTDRADGQLFRRPTKNRASTSGSIAIDRTDTPGVVPVGPFA